MGKRKSSAFIPNELLDALGLSNLTGAALKVLIVLIRLTIGWKDKHEGDFISLSQIEKRTSISRTAIRKGLSELRKKGFITQLEPPKKRRPGKWKVNLTMLSGAQSRCTPVHSNSALQLHSECHYSAQSTGHYSDTTIDKNLIDSSEIEREENSTPEENKTRPGENDRVSRLLSVVEETYLQEAGNKLIFPRFKKDDLRNFLQQLEEIDDETLASLVKDAIPAARRRPDIHFVDYFAKSFQFHFDRVQGDQNRLSDFDDEWIRVALRENPNLQPLYDQVKENYGKAEAARVIKKELEPKKPEVSFLSTSNGLVVGWQVIYQGQVIHKGEFNPPKERGDPFTGEEDIPDEIYGLVLDAWYGR